MIQIDFDASNYEYVEELKTFVNSINDLFDKFGKSFDDRYASIRKLEKEIEKKKKSIENASSNIEEFQKRDEELSSLKRKATEDIEALIAKKKDMSYTDKEVEALEKEDIDVLVSSKNEKIAKIDSKILVTKEKIMLNRESKLQEEKDLEELLDSKHQTEESLTITESILACIESTKETFNRDLANLLNCSSDDDSDEEDGFKIEEANKDYSVVDFDLKEIEIPYNDKPNITIELNEESNDETPRDNNEKIDELNEFLNTGELSVLDLDTTLSEEESISITSEDLDESLKESFEKEGINYDLFDNFSKQKMEENKKRTLDNLEILKRHNVPLSATIRQSEIYYNIDSKELEDLFNVITTDEDGNGMGFSVDYTFYILKELSSVNLDKLIDVYNSEFMNMNSKTGLIGLIKLTNKELDDFKANREANMDVLNSIGVTTTNAITAMYPDFINMDNPLFLKVLNLFDKDDLVQKLNSDIKIVPKLLSYWKAN